MIFSTDFFRDEVRCGFYVPTAIKQVWAAELMVLGEIDRICRKYDIKYYAEWGTLLGAVRHGGFVPWDDDMDIGMLRKDYIRFREVAEKELPKEYVIHDYASKDDHWMFLSRVVSRNQICYEEEHLNKYHNFPYMAAIDIFVSDYLYRDEEKEKERCDEILYILAVADLIVQKGIDDNLKEILKKLEIKYHTRLSGSGSARDLGVRLYRLAEQQMARVPEYEADSIGQIFPWILKGRKGVAKEYYAKTVRLPFENTTIPVPADYCTITGKRYRNFLTIRKVWGGHGYPAFEGQRNALQAIADFKLPEYTFSPEMLANKQPVDKGFKEIVKEYIGVLDGLMNGLKENAAENTWGESLDILPECQQLAVDLGTLIEDIKGENNQNVREIVACVEAYCEAVYETYRLLTDMDNALDHQKIGDSVVASQNAYDVMRRAIDERLLQKKVILFITTGSKQWNGFKNLCQSCMDDENNEVYGVLVPVVFKDCAGNADFSNIEQPEDNEFFPREIEVRGWKDIDVSLLQPDIIYIQDPYDNVNPCLTIPPQFYSSNLRNYTASLIYVPAFYVNEFGEEDTNDVYNMKHYVTAPAVMYADYILLQSENTKKMYMEKLVEFAGEEAREVWDGKLKVAKLYDEITELPAKTKEKNKDLNNKKTIVYCIGLNELAQKGMIAVDTIREKLEIFEENRTRHNLMVGLYPPDLDTWKNADGGVTQQITKLLEKYTKQEWCEICDINYANMKDIAEESDAYYGSPSPLVLMFTAVGKPVMIAR
ncbi:MAG: LicD family protein [Acetatifactor sp.]|nr:LicD family protein [Acetatifactor sp.]